MLAHGRRWWHVQGAKGVGFRTAGGSSMFGVSLHVDVLFEGTLYVFVQGKLKGQPFFVGN